MSETNDTLIRGILELLNSVRDKPDVFQKIRKVLPPNLGKLKDFKLSKLDNMFDKIDLIITKEELKQEREAKRNKPKRKTKKQIEAERIASIPERRKGSVVEISQLSKPLQKHQREFIDNFVNMLV